MAEISFKEALATAKDSHPLQRFARFCSAEFEHGTGEIFPPGWYVWTGGQFAATMRRISDHVDVNDFVALSDAGYFILPPTAAIGGERAAARAEKEARNALHAKD